MNIIILNKDNILKHLKKGFRYSFYYSLIQILMPYNMWQLIHNHSLNNGDQLNILK